MAKLARRPAFNMILIAWLLYPGAAVGEKNALSDESFNTSESLQSKATAQVYAEKTALVFDNALLDRLFGSTRSVPRGHDNNQASDPNLAVEPGPNVELALLQPNQPFTAKLGSGVSAQQAAALRFAEQGRKYLSERDHQRALRCFEKALSVGATDYLPYIYFYLAQTHFYLANHEASNGFLGAAEARLNEYPDWSVSIVSLKEGNTGAPSYASKTNSAAKSG